MCESEEMMMKTCGDCIHYEICDPYVTPNESFPEVKGGCTCFKPKSRYIELPCVVGQTVYYISFGKVYKGKCHAITLKPTMQIHLYDYDGDNASISADKVFLTKEEAEQALLRKEDEGK